MSVTSLTHFAANKRIDRVIDNLELDAYDGLYSPVAWVADGLRFSGRPCSSMTEIAAAIMDGSLDMAGPADELADVLAHLFSANWMTRDELRQFGGLINDNVLGIVAIRAERRRVRCQTGAWPAATPISHDPTRMLTHRPKTCSVWDSWWARETDRMLRLAKDLP